MNNQFEVLIIALISIFMLESCSNEVRTKTGSDTEISTPAKQMMIDIPRRHDGTPVKTYGIKQQFERKLGLDELENGFDSLQIRIWYGYALNDTTKLLIIENVKDKWSAKFTNIVSYLNERGDSILSLQVAFHYETPRSGWPVFINKLFELQILTLPNMSDITKDFSVAHGDAFTVEFATTSRYRFYLYQSPEMVKDRLWQAGKMEEILQLIKSELNCY